MTRKIKYWAAALVLACMIAVMPSQLMTAFAATARIAFSDPSGSVGSQISVNMKITSSDNLASADIMLAYDASALEFVSGTSAEGGNGAVRVHGDGGTPNTGTLAFSLKFKALTAGSSKITVTSQEIYDSNSQLVTVDRQGDSTITVSALQTASKDASLSSLQVSPGTLTPEFSPEVDTYGVTVGTDVDKLIVNAQCTDGNATHVVSGNENLQMGENRVVCKVVAQDGETSKEYVIVVTKAEGGASAASGEGGAQFKMRVSERVITVLDPDDSVEIPEGFKERTIKMDGNQVKGWVWGADAEPQYCVIYGMNEAGEKDFYRYDMKDTERTLQRYFRDPAAADSVSQEVYDQLAVQYDSLRKDFSLFKILLIAAIVIALILLVLLIVAVAGKGGKSRGADSGSSRRRGHDELEEEDESYDEEEYEDEEGYEEDSEGLYEEDSYPEEEDEEPYEAEEDGDTYEEDAYEDEAEDERVSTGNARPSSRPASEPAGRVQRPSSRTSARVSAEEREAAPARRPARQTAAVQSGETASLQAPASQSRGTAAHGTSASRQAGASQSRGTAAQQASASQSRGTAARQASASQSRGTAAQQASVSQSRETAVRQASASQSRGTAAHGTSASQQAAAPGSRGSAAQRNAASKPASAVPQAAAQPDDDDFEIFDL